MPSENLNQVFLELFQLSEAYVAPIETIVTLFTIKYCDSDIKIKFIKGNSDQSRKEKFYNLDISSFRYEILEENSPIQDTRNSCALPHIVVNEFSCIAGLCATLRQIVKGSLKKNAENQCLLGFKKSCLLACSETSVWTKFCEVDIISTLKFFDINDELPITLARFECHMSQPVRLHNIYKYINKNEKKIPEHIYAEGSTISLADIIIFVCIYIFFDNMNIMRIWNEGIIKLLPLTYKWYMRMIQGERIFECLTILSLEEDNEKVIKSDITRNYTLPVVQNQSLYKSDPKRYKPRNRIFTRQEDIDNSLGIIRNANVNTSLTGVIYAGENNFDWSLIPFDATPEGGALPISRLKRKFEQLENLCKPVISIAKDNDIIVDFCSGGGHLGIIIAYLLPRCKVILLENKEESLNKAKERVKKLKLTNVKFYQCNLDYFKVRKLFFLF